MAIWAGAVLVKAECHHVLTVPDIYTDEIYVPFKPDCSDLATVVREVLGNIEPYQQRSHTGRELFQEWDGEKHIDHFCNMVRQVTQNHQE